MVIILNDKYRLTHDTTSWRIQIDMPPVEIPVGKKKGQMSEGGFKFVDKYWPNPEQAVRWVVTQMIKDEECTLSLEEFTKKLEDIQYGMVESIKSYKL